MKNEIAILMAAGFGTRMAPLTERVPKPLVRVFDKPMIETIIDGLRRRGVKQIYIVVGYRKEQFTYLAERYENVSLIENTEYTTKNNISSIHAACDVMGSENCFICESDLCVMDTTIFDAKLDHSCYYGKMVAGHSDDWVFDLDENGRIVRVGKYGDNVYNMVGVSYFLADDAKVLADAIREAYRHSGHEQLYWDEVVDSNLDRLDLNIYPVTGEQIVELDSVAELEAVDPNYLMYNEVDE